MVTAQGLPTDTSEQYFLFVCINPCVESRGRSDYGDRRRDDRGGGRGFDNYNNDRSGGGGYGRDRDGGGFDNYNRDGGRAGGYNDRGGDRYGGDRGGDRYGDNIS